MRKESMKEKEKVIKCKKRKEIEMNRREKKRKREKRKRKEKENKRMKREKNRERESKKDWKRKWQKRKKSLRKDSEWEKNVKKEGKKRGKLKKKTPLRKWSERELKMENREREIVENGLFPAEREQNLSIWILVNIRTSLEYGQVSWEVHSKCGWVCIKRLTKKNKIPRSISNEKNFFSRKLCVGEALESSQRNHPFLSLKSHHIVFNLFYRYSSQLNSVRKKKQEKKIDGSSCSSKNLLAVVIYSWLMSSNWTFLKYPPEDWTEKIIKLFKTRPLEILEDQWISPKC